MRLHVCVVGPTIYINSNGRCDGYDRAGAEQLHEFLGRVLAGETSIQNYEDPVRVRVPVTSAPGQSLRGTADLLADLGLTESKT